ncbi:hemagglutinin repeat-containing protein [Campylobacter hepaticus]
MNFNKGKFVRLSLNLTLLSALFPCVLLSADLRQRNGNVIVSKNTSITHSSNGTDVINVNNPNKNGVSHNQFDDFNVQDGVIFNNSLIGGNSQIGGWVDKNPNLQQNANTIINEIMSKQASGIHGNIEVFGKSANLIFANENGFSINGASFLNTTGVTFSTGKFNGDNITDVGSNGKISIGDKGVAVDGDYFNVISRSIDIAGSIAHYRQGKNLSNINFIAGLNKVDLSNPNLPKILASRQTNDKIDYGIDGRNLGSMYANTVTLVSTEEGVGVRHTGVIRGLKDIIVKVNGDAQFQALGVNSGGSVGIDARNITTSLIDADNMNLNADGKITNEGLYRGKNIKIDAKDFENAKKDTLSKETRDIFKTDQDGSKILAENLDLHTTGKMSNFGSINTLKDLRITTGGFENKGKISSNEDVYLTLNNDDFVNRGQVFSQHDIKVQANKDLTLNDGNLFADHLLSVKSSGDLNINGKLENSSSVDLEAQNIYNRNLVASGKNLSLHASNNIINNGYFFAVNDLIAKAFHIGNNSTFNSLNNMYLNAEAIDNYGLIVASKDINIETIVLTNNASLTRSLDASSQRIEGNGWANYGDTAFKRWNMDIGIDILKYTNNLDSKQASIQAGGNININVNSKNQSAFIFNRGKIIAQGDITTFGNIDNKTLSQDMSVEEILARMKLDKLFAKEFLGSWNTNWKDYLARGGNLLNALRYFATANLKDHQRESAWNAFKDAAAHNETLNLYFSLLFGSDYASKRFIPKVSEWNHDAKIVFKSKSEAVISSNGKLNVNANEYDQGLVSSFNKNSSLIKSQLKDELNKQDLLSTIPDMANTGLFHYTNKKDGEITYQYTSNHAIVDPDYYGFKDVAKEFKNKDSDTNNVIGDSFFQHQLLKSMYEKYGLGGVLSDEDIERLLKNGADYANKHNLKLGQGLGKDQEVDNDMIIFEKVNRDGKEVLIPRFYFSKKTLEDNKLSSNLSGKNGVNVNTNSFNSSLGSVDSKGKVNINAKDKVDLHSTSVKGDDVNINAGEVNIDTFSGIDEKGSRNSIDKSEVSAKNHINIDSDKDINIKNSDLVGEADDSKIVLHSKDGNINITNDYSNTSSFKNTDTNNEKSNTSKTTDGVLSSNLKAGDVDIISNKDVNIQGSNIDANSEINIKGNNVNITDAHEKSSTTFDGIYFGTASITHQSGSSQSSKSIGSKLSSKGDIKIDAKKDINIEGSDLKAQKSADLDAENINIKNGENKVSYSLDSSSLSALGYRYDSVNSDSTLASSSNVEAGNLNLHAKDKATITGSHLGGGDINIHANGVDFKAAQNKTHTQSNSSAIGFFANTDIGLGGYGVGAKYSFTDGISSAGKTYDDNFRGSSTLGSSEVGIEFARTQKTENEVSHLSSSVTGSNINIDADGTLDIGGGNFEAEKDINLKGGEVISTKYEDSKTEDSSRFGIYVKERLEVGGLAVSALNQGIATLSSDRGVNHGIPVVQGLATTLGVLHDHIAEASAGESVGLGFEKEHERSSKENTTHLKAGGKLNIESTKGDVTLNGVDAKAGEININAKENFTANASKSSHSSSSTSFEMEVGKKTVAGYNVFDGGTVGGEIEFSAGGSRSKEDETKYHNSHFDGKNVSIKTGKDATLNGANVKASNDVNLDIGGDLNVNSLKDQSHSDKYSVSLGGTVELDLSSNHIVSGDFSGTVGVGYGKKDSQTVGEQSGISAKNEIKGNVNGDLSLDGGVINSDTQKGNLNVGGKVKGSDIKVYEKGDGAHVSLTGTSDHVYKAKINIDDHIDKTGSVNSAINIDVNGKKDHGLSQDTKDTQHMQDNSWDGGNVNIGIFTHKIKDGVNKFIDSGSDGHGANPHRGNHGGANAGAQNPNVNGPQANNHGGANANGAQNGGADNGPYINETTQTTRL